jgi:hypothetical protein
MEVNVRRSQGEPHTLYDLVRYESRNLYRLPTPHAELQRSR